MLKILVPAIAAIGLVLVVLNGAVGALVKAMGY